MNQDNLTISIAFIAGLVSFISPCVLPLVPAYIGYMGGRVTNSVSMQLAVVGGDKVKMPTPVTSRLSTALHGLFFVAGFTFIFVAIGLLTTAFIRQISGENIRLVTNIIGRFGGLVIVFFGIYFMGILPTIFVRIRGLNTQCIRLFSTVVMVLGCIVLIWGFTGSIFLWETPLWEGNTGWVPTLALVWVTVFVLWLVLGGAFTRPGRFWAQILNFVERWLYADTRRQIVASNHPRYGGSFLMGIVFSAGWTPCIGPVYGAVLTMAANGGDVGRAGFLLVGYSLGLGVPFLLTALLLDSAQGMLRSLQRHMHTVELISGAFLVIIGVAVASGRLQELSSSFANNPQIVQAATNLERSVVGGLIGENIESTPGPTATASNSDLPFLETGIVGNSTNAIGGSNSSVSSGLGTIEQAAESVDTPIGGTDVGNLAPDFETSTATGETVSLADLQGQIVLLNFWATWCGPCRLEMPEFEAAYRARAAQGFVVLAVNNRESLEDVTSFRDELGLTFTLALDEQGYIQDLYGIVGYPSTYVINRHGVIMARHFGPLTATQIEELINQALA